ncbi:MAG: hypothetical protein NTAFB05_14200 [Nitrobacter sp.]
MAHRQINQSRPDHNPGSERADIVRRVASFKAHQARLQQERNAYYESVRAQMSRTLDGTRRTNTANPPE